MQIEQTFQSPLASREISTHYLALYILDAMGVLLYTVHTHFKGHLCQQSGPIAALLGGNPNRRLAYAVPFLNESPSSLHQLVIDTYVHVCWT